MQSKGPEQVGKLDQDDIDKFQKSKKLLEDEIDNLNIENKNLKENNKDLKKQRAEFREKIE